jgi:hypothetical protein
MFLIIAEIIIANFFSFVFGINKYKACYDRFQQNATLCPIGQDFSLSLFLSFSLFIIFDFEQTYDACSNSYIYPLGLKVSNFLLDCLKDQGIRTIILLPYISNIW